MLKSIITSLENDNAICSSVYHSVISFLFPVFHGIIQWEKTYENSWYISFNHLLSLSILIRQIYHTHSMVKFNVSSGNLFPIHNLDICRISKFVTSSHRSIIRLSLPQNQFGPESLTLIYNHEWHFLLKGYGLLSVTQPFNVLNCEQILALSDGSKFASCKRHIYTFDLSKYYGKMDGTGVHKMKIARSYK